MPSHSSYYIHIVHSLSHFKVLKRFKQNKRGRPLPSFSSPLFPHAPPKGTGLGAGIMPTLFYWLTRPLESRPSHKNNTYLVRQTS